MNALTRVLAALLIFGGMTIAVEVAFARRPGPRTVPVIPRPTNAAVAFQNAKQLLGGCAAMTVLSEQLNCIQGVINQLKEGANFLLVRPANNTLQAWCDAVGGLAQSVSSCNALKERLGDANVARAIRCNPSGDTANLYQQQIAQIGSAQPGSGTSAACREQSNELRSCLLSVQVTFSQQRDNRGQSCNSQGGENPPVPRQN